MLLTIECSLLILRLRDTKMSVKFKSQSKIKIYGQIY